jgi:hypothetical protein
MKTAVRWSVGIASLGAVMLVVGAALMFHSGPPMMCLQTVDGAGSMTQCLERLARLERQEQLANAAWFGTGASLTVLGTALALTHGLRRADDRERPGDGGQRE